MSYCESVNALIFCGQSLTTSPTLHHYSPLHPSSSLFSVDLTTSRRWLLHLELSPRRTNHHLSPEWMDVAVSSTYFLVFVLPFWFLFINLVSYFSHLPTISSFLSFACFSSPCGTYQSSLVMHHQVQVYRFQRSGCSSLTFISTLCHSLPALTNADF